MALGVGSGEGLRVPVPAGFALTSAPVPTLVPPLPSATARAEQPASASAHTAAAPQARPIRRRLTSVGLVLPVLPAVPVVIAIPLWCVSMCDVRDLYARHGRPGCIGPRKFRKLRRGA